MAVEDWLALESLKSKVNKIFPSLDLKLKPPTEDHSSEFTLEGYRVNIIESKYSHEMGILDSEYLGYNSSHDEFVKLYESVINNETNLSDVKKTWRFPSLYFITVSKNFHDIEKNDERIIQFIGEEIRDDKLYNICKKENGNMLTVEKLIYIGRTTDIVNRFRDGHKVTQALSDSKYDGTKKRIYIAEIDIFNIFDFKKSTGISNFQDKFLEFTPIESINNRELIDDIQIFLERYFISHYLVPVYNVKDKTPKVNFVKWPMVSKPKLITINDFSESCLFKELKFEPEFSIDELLEEPRRKYENSMKYIKQKEQQFREEK